MVRAILEGRKTQTRRIIKPQPKDIDDFLGVGISGDRAAIQCNGLARVIKCPQGKPADRLWVKETFATYNGPGIIVNQTDPHVLGSSNSLQNVCLAVTHKAGRENHAWGMYGEPKWKSSRFMPRTASRITLTLQTSEPRRLQEISEADCVAEGVQVPVTTEGCPPGKARILTQLTGPGPCNAFAPCTYLPDGDDSMGAYSRARQTSDVRSGDR